MGRTAEKIPRKGRNCIPRSNRSTMRRDAKGEAARARRRDEKIAIRMGTEPRRTPFAGWAD